MNEEFAKEIEMGEISPIQAEKNLATVAIVGENMKHTPGIAGKLFGTLGRNGINVIACAQGASETNISFVVDSKSLRKSLNVIHDSFFLSEYQVLNLFICGIGTVGGSLVEQIRCQQQKLMMEQRFLREGHAFASMRAAAHFSVEAAMNERCSGVSYYHFLCGLQEEADWAGLGRRLEALRQKVLGGNALTVSLHGSDAALDTLKKLLPGSAFAAGERRAAVPYREALAPAVNEAFVIDGGVNYDVLAWPMERRLERKVLARVMSYEYLWHSIREVGGAYGTGMVTQNDDVEYLYTYRDPHLAESYEAFAAGPAELAGRDYTENDMNEFIVGAAAKLDTPRKPRDEAAATDCKYFCGITDEMNAAERKNLCSVDPAALKAEAADLSVRMEKGVRVAFGSKEAVEAAKALFDRVETL